MKKHKKSNSPLQDDRNIKKCQIWRFPIEEIERLLLNGKITFRYKTTGYDIFCPACNLFFKKKDDYQGLGSATCLQKQVDEQVFIPELKILTGLSGQAFFHGLNSDRKEL